MEVLTGCPRAGCCGPVDANKSERRRPAVLRIIQGAETAGLGWRQTGPWLGSMDSIWWTGQERFKGQNQFLSFGRLRVKIVLAAQQRLGRALVRKPRSVSRGACVIPARQAVFPHLPSVPAYELVFEPPSPHKTVHPAPVLCT